MIVGMKAVRILIAAVLLVWSPLSGALAAALGSPVSHHHCDDVWHGHDGHNGIVAEAAEDCGSGAVNADPWNCSDCQIVQAALPTPELFLMRPPTPQFQESAAVAAQTHVVFSLFRPARA